MTGTRLPTGTRERAANRTSLAVQSISASGGAPFCLTLVSVLVSLKVSSS